MNKDKYNEVINGERTYKQVADVLGMHGTCLVGWTDEQGTHFDILFTILNVHFLKWGQIQGGIRGTDLFVSIMRRGSFGFDISRTDTHGGYYDQKLNIGSNVTADKVAELINGVKKELKKDNDK